MNYLKVLFILMCAAGVYASPASALSISPDPLSADYVLETASGAETSNAAIWDAIDPYLGITDPDSSKNYELYKDNVGGVEEGDLAGSYTTTYSGSGPNNATITWDGGAYMTSPSWLVVKDGAQDPAWYLYELAPALGWDGMETIYLSDFWAGTTGGISHVALYSTSTPVPEPATMLLLGTGLVGLAAGARRRLKKA